MKTLMISPGWLFAMLVVHTLVVFGAGWFVGLFYLRSRRARRRHRDVAAQGDGQAVAPQELLDEMQGALTDHASAIACFDKALKAGAKRLDGADSGVAAEVDTMRLANRELASTLNHTSGELARVESVYRNLLQQELDRVRAYASQTEEFDWAIAELDVERPLPELVEAVFKTIDQLRETNSHLQQELQESHHQLAEQTRRADAAEKDARIDILTQLPNRRAFDERLAELQSLQQRHAQSYALVLFDIDGFKEVNDVHGHAAGDAVLAMVGRVFAESRRTTDHVSRRGGDEFALLAARCSGEQARAVAERFRRRLAVASLRYGSERLYVTLSAGIAWVDSETPADTLLERADMALYQAKKEGGNCCRCFDETVPATVPTSG